MQIEPEQFQAMHKEALWLSLKGFRNTFHLHFRFWSPHETVTFSSNSTFVERSVIWKRKAFLIYFTTKGGEAPKSPTNFIPSSFQMGFPSRDSTIIP